MWQKGSITVFYSLILTLILALISSLLLSAKISASRAQIAMAMDQTMFSAMAKYDAKLLEEYHLFFLDGGYGSHTLQSGKILDELESDISYLLKPSKEKTLWGAIDFLELSLESSGITGYTLATDQKGSVFREQVVQYMEDTMVLRGVSSLMEMLVKPDSESSGIVDWIFQSQGIANQGSVLERLENITEGFSVEDLEQGAANPATGNTEGAGSNGVDRNESSEKISANRGDLALTTEEKAEVENTKEVLKSVKKLKSTGILKLVIKSPEKLSDWETQEKLLVSNRNCQSGMGVIETIEKTDTLKAKYLFQEYLIQNINHYKNQLHETGPAYGLEYIIGGKASDIENLETVVGRLLLMRQVANTAYLYTDAEKRGSAQAIAALVTSAVLLPELAPVVEAAILLAWAYVESIVDVRGLLSGKSVPLLKDGASWQVGFENLLTAISDPDGCVRSSGNTYYKDYLNLLLITVSEEKQTMRCMDVIELTMRGLSGKEGFSMDCAIDTLEITMDIEAEGEKAFEITERRCYRAM